VTKPATYHSLSKGPKLQPQGLSGSCRAYRSTHLPISSPRAPTSGLSEDPNDFDCNPPSGTKLSGFATRADDKAYTPSHVISAWPPDMGYYAQALPLAHLSTYLHHRPHRFVFHVELSPSSFSLLQYVWLGHFPQA
jgi:hypothetical protein